MAAVLVFFYGLGFLVAGILLVYFIIKRYQDRKNEDFEKRDY
jgi:hypothetical protein